MPSHPPMPSPLPHSAGRAGWLTLVVASLCLGGCGSNPARTGVSELEHFASASTHVRHFAASDGATCEAARRALLSQGYVIGEASRDAVQGKKRYQPEAEMHVEVEMRVTCAREGKVGGATLAFATALQDRYTLRKSNSSASLGVGALGSVSLPFTASEESLVKVASETISSPAFYTRFFALLDSYLAGQPEDAQPPAVVRPAPPPMAAVPAPVRLGAPASLTVLPSTVLVAPAAASAAPATAGVEPGASAPAVPVPAAAAASAPASAASAGSTP